MPVAAGDKFGRLTVIGKAGVKNKQLIWECLCSCGTVKDVAGASLTKGLTKSCGCYRNEVSSARCKDNKTHGQTNSRAYAIWLGMKTRCLNKKHKLYPEWGGRGISIDPAWTVFEKFLEDMGHPPENLSLERVHNDRGYSKENCIWATPKQQSNNTRTNVVLEFAGRKQTATQWAEELGFKPYQILLRIARGWSTQRALTTPINKYRKR